MNGNKFTKPIWISIAVGFALAFVGIFAMIAVDPMVGTVISIIGLGSAMLCVILLVIQSIRKTENPRKMGFNFIWILVAEFVVIGLGIALDLGGIGTLILAAVILAIGFRIKKSIDETACPKCGKKLSMKEINRQIISSYETTIDLERQVKNNAGKVIETYTETVPATHYIYTCVDECKYCGHRQQVHREETCRN